METGGVDEPDQIPGQGGFSYFPKARLVNGHLPGLEHGRAVRIEIHSGDIVPCVGQARSGHCSNVSQTYDCNFQGGLSSDNLIIVETAHKD